ncbi:MAG: LCP family protein [Bacillota bacterium]
MRWGRLALLGLAILLIFAIVVSGSLYAFMRGIHTDLTSLIGGGPKKQVPAPQPGQPINILVMGLDEAQDTTGYGVQQDLRFAKIGRRTDTMILFSFNPAEHSLSMVSIPRDSEVIIPGFENQGIQKINAAHAFGDSQAVALAAKQKLKYFPNSMGPELAMDVVSKLLGVPVHYYLRTDVAGFVKLVDILGGVEMDVPQDMNYDDPYQNLHIHLKKGSQFLNGEKAMGLVRFRKYEDGDISRVKVQQEFFKAVMKKALSVGALFKIPSLAAAASKYIDTNLTPSQMLSLGTQALRLSPDKVQSGTLPVGQYEMIRGESFVKLDMAGVQKMVDELIRGIDRAANAKIKVQVLNGSGVNGKASALAGQLREFGFSVASVGTADKGSYPVTQVIGLDGEASLQTVGKAVTGLVPTAKYYRRTAKDPQYSVTIIVGKDYR